MRALTLRIIPGMVLVLNLALTAADEAPKKDGSLLVADKMVEY
jgi:hypothetical protein